MANWKALHWAETVTTGKAPARQVLDKLCLKCTDDGRVYRDTGDVAAMCEMGYRTLVRHLDYLEEQSLITQVRRMTPKGREANPVVLINYPEADHLHGGVVLLDHPTSTGVRTLYPRSPIALLELGIAWTSNGKPGGVSPSHADTVAAWQASQPANLAGGQPANLASGVSSEDSETPQASQPANLAGGQPANLASGVSSEDSETPRANSLPIWHPLTNHPQEQSPTRPIPNATSKVGWSGQQNNSGAELSPGDKFLQELGISGKALHTWAPTVTSALSTLGHEATRNQLLGGTETPGTGAIVKTRLPALATQLAAASHQTGTSKTSKRLPWCGADGSDERDECQPETRYRVPRDGSRSYKCPDCHHAVAAATASNASVAEDAVSEQPHEPDDSPRASSAQEVPRVFSNRTAA